MKVDSYKFGEVLIEGKRYTSDVIIFPDHVQSGWRRSGHHQVAPEDIGEVIKEKPEVLVVGTGYDGLVKVLLETQRYLEEQGVKLIVQPTGEAWQTYNRLCSSGKAVAAFHLTC